MMEFQVAETIEQLEGQHAALTQRIRALVEEDEDPDQAARLLRDKAALAHRIDAAKGERERTEQQRQRQERARAESELPEAIAECATQRAALLEHVRGSCIAWGRFLLAMDKAASLTNKTAVSPFGPKAEFVTALRALDLGNAMQQAVADLKPDMGAGWQLSFLVAPKYER